MAKTFGRSPHEFLELTPAEYAVSMESFRVGSAEERRQAERETRRAVAAARRGGR